MNYNLSEIRENYEINSYKISQFSEEVTYSHLFKVFADKKLIPIGLFRENNERLKRFIMIPENSKILKVF